MPEHSEEVNKKRTEPPGGPTSVSHPGSSTSPFSVIERHFDQLHQILSPDWASKLDR